MDIEKIKEKLLIKIYQSGKWVEKLEDTSPGHYGVIESEPIISEENIYVHVPSRKFDFKNVEFKFELQMMGSSKEDGVPQSFSKVSKGEGLFKFINDNKDIEIEEIEIDFDLDLYAD